MKAIFSMFAAGLFLTAAARGGDVNVVLDSANGTSAFRVLNSVSNALLEADSGVNLRLGLHSIPVLDQQQWNFSNSEYLSSGSVWQSFTVGKAGRLSHIVWWNNYYHGSASGLLRIRQGEGTGGAVLWSKAVTWNEYAPRVAVDSNIIVSVGDVLTIEMAYTTDALRPGYAGGNPYAGGRSSLDPSWDFLFETYVVVPASNAALVSVPNGNLGVGVEPASSSARLTVSGNAVVTGSVTAASFAGSGAGITGIGNASIAVGANIEPAKIAGTAVTLASPPGGDLSGTFTNLQLKANSVGANEITNGAVVRSLNTFRDNVTLAAGRNITVSNASGVITVDAGGAEVGVPPTAIVLSTNPTNRELERANFSLLYKTEDRDTWTRATAAAAWTNRMLPSLLSFNGRLWLLGGETNAGVSSEVWSSTNGANWTLATAAPGWSARWGHASVVFSNRMWVLGGGGAGGLLRDVWSSTNGTAWTQVTPHAPWTNRDQHACVVFSGKIWLLGGRFDESWTHGQMNDVWSSSNGTNWTLETEAAAWSIRCMHGAAVYDGRIWIMGGYGEAVEHNDVWSSTNGADWAEATGAAAWSARLGPVALMYDGRLWIVGGGNNNDVWYSTSGSSWTQITGAAPWAGRIYHVGVVHDDRMWIAAGTSGNMLNDVWYSGKPDLLSGFYLYQKR